MGTNKRKRTPITPYGRWICTRLMELQMSQRELAEAIQIHPQHLSGMIHGTYAGLKYRPAIEKLLGKCPQEYLPEAS